MLALDHSKYQGAKDPRARRNCGASRCEATSLKGRLGRYPVFWVFFVPPSVEDCLLECAAVISVRLPYLVSLGAR